MVSASAVAMASQVEEVNARAEDLATTADQLRTLVAQFRLEQSAPAEERQPRRRASDRLARLTRVS